MSAEMPDLASAIEEGRARKVYPDTWNSRAVAYTCGGEHGPCDACLACEEAAKMDAPPIELDSLLRNEDKLYLIERLIEQQAPLGTDMANFRRRLLLVVRA